MLRTLIAAFAATAALLGAASAQAGTQWSIGINLPATGVVVSNGGGYYASAPVYYEPAPVVRYAPRYVHRDVYYAQPAPRVVYAPVYRDHRWHHGHRHHDRHHHHWDRGHDRHDHRDHGPRRGH